MCLPGILQYQESEPSRQVVELNLVLWVLAVASIARDSSRVLYLRVLVAKLEVSLCALYPNLQVSQSFGDLN